MRLHLGRTQIGSECHLNGRSSYRRESSEDEAGQLVCADKKLLMQQIFVSCAGTPQDLKPRPSHLLGTAYKRLLVQESISFLCERSSRSQISTGDRLGIAYKIILVQQIYICA